MARRSILLLVLICAAASPWLADAQPSAFDLLAGVRDAYAKIETYHDRGEIEVVGAGVEARTIRFETVREGADVFRLWAEIDDGVTVRHRLLWRQGDAIFLFDVERGQYRRLSSVVSGLVDLAGRELLDALVAASAVAGSSAAFADVDGAAFEGDEPCDAATCRLLLLSRLQGKIETLLSIDADTLLIRRVEVTVYPVGDDLGEALRDAGVAVRPGSTAARGGYTLRARHEVVAVDEPLSPEIMERPPPAQARLVEQWEEPPPPVAPDDGSQIVIHDEIEVDLTSIVVRVIARDGDPVVGLGRDDFRVVAGKTEIPVAGLDYYSSAPEDAGEASQGDQGGTTLPAAAADYIANDRLVVFFVQSGFEPSRLRGHLRTLRYLDNVTSSLRSGDWAAVVSFDSHLKLRVDFTRDFEAIEPAVYDAIRGGGESLPVGRQSRSRLSLAAQPPMMEGRRAASPEKALELVARALEPLPGEKILIYLGWGLGRMNSSGGVSMPPDYGKAIEAFEAGRTTVFVLDISDADYHTLEIGLEEVAADTGGTYAKTHLFTESATKRLARTIAGYYLLMIDPDLVPARATVRVELREKKKGRILAPRFIAPGRP